MMDGAWTSERLHEALRRHFGYETFRDGQAEAILNLLAGQDVMLVMPTGSGKSLCYQLTALLMPGVTVVVSPLIALMKDQVDALERRGIAATFLNSSVDGAEMAYRLDGVRAGRYKLVYVAPERFRNRRFSEALAQAQVSLFTIDEAHCISQWGHDFRPDYLNLNQVLAKLGTARVLAVTATATPDVREDIVRQLGLGESPRQAPAVSVTGFARPNLYLAVTRCPTHRHKFSRLVQTVEAYRCGIVYCSTRKMVERVAARLKSDGFAPITYHGAMADSERTAAQDRFMAEAAPLVVATNAFGMGVDRGDLRFVVHWDIPGSLEAYYQEVGRAGRDGASAWCELLFNYADVATQRFFLDGANPSFSDILAVWQAVRQACAAEPVTAPVEEWTRLTGVKNDMEVRTILGLIERAHLIEREILPGNRAYTTRLLPNPDPDVKELKRLAAGLDEKRQRDERKLETLLHFVDHPGCRHAFMLNYFGDRTPASSCSACDRCRRREPRPPTALTEEQWIELQKILSCVTRMKGRFGAQRIAQVLHGDSDETLTRHALDQLSTFGLLADKTVPHIRAVLDALQGEGCVTVTTDTYRLVSITPKGREVMMRRLEGFRMAWPQKRLPLQRRAFLTAAGSAVAGLIGGCGTPCAARNARAPNVVFVLADQWRAQACGYAGDPNLLGMTPTIDRLAAESANFTHAVSCCPVCSPYRASLLTGQYPLTNGLFLNDVCLSTRATSLAQAYAQAGYDTAYIGKWHLDGHGRSAYIPPERRQGFDYWKVLECTHAYNRSPYYAGNDPQQRLWEGYDAFAQTRDAEAYIADRARRDTPFLLVLSWGPPHNPYETAPERFKARFAADRLTLRDNVTGDLAAWRRDLAGYYAHIAALDESLGHLLATIDNAGLRDDTIVVFTSDHGDMLGSHGQMRKQKPWDESIRVPLLIRGPGVMNRAIDMPINTPDLMPTLLGACGVPVPASAQGTDFSPVLCGARLPDDNPVLIQCPSPFGEWTRARGGRGRRGRGDLDRRPEGVRRGGQPRV